jgi:hypothetical protein
MHERLFAQSQNQPRTVVLGLVMQPYSIGHDLLLIQQDNLFSQGQVAPPSDKEKRFHLIRAALICCQSWGMNKRPHRNMWLFRLRNRWVDYDREISKFNLYRAIGIMQPMVMSPKGAESERPLGSPFHAMLLQFLCTVMRMSEGDALDYPLGAAKMHFYAWCEARGTVCVLNDREQAFEEECARRDAEWLKQQEDKKNASVGSNH